MSRLVLCCVQHKAEPTKGPSCRPDVYALNVVCGGVVKIGYQLALLAGIEHSATSAIVLLRVKTCHDA